ncbi:galactose-4-epimerase, UDP [Tribonema minus]|uniref:UDP-glucose 4-epimerase n=1 Tax=Tribonema minus TaxID=303371 RepID=A0A835YLY8_9STRA|nr:galactose-4-epimerase, UDP [Tribonema minus]
MVKQITAWAALSALVTLSPCAQAFARVLVTGGAGYIGSHTCLELIKAGEEVVVVDNLINAVEESLERVIQLTGCNRKQLQFRKVDLLDRKGLRKVFEEFKFDSCIHFAGLKAVGESVAKPLMYYRNNIEGTLNLVEAMREHGCKKLVFSSSATVYGTPEKLPLDEKSRVGPGITNPYGRTKYMIEEILRDEQVADPTWEILILRYFNPIGAHESGRIGEDPDGIPNNLMPFVAQVAVGRREFLAVFGDDYSTPDGTGVRDYIHVCDLAEGHVAALNKLRKGGVGCEAVNLGTGKGYSVFEVVKAMEAASGKKIPYKVVPRRAGDVEAMYADPSFAKQYLTWSATRGLKEMCEDTWRWQSKNPHGYAPVEAADAGTGGQDIVEIDADGGEVNMASLRNSRIVKEAGKHQSGSSSVAHELK